MPALVAGIHVFTRANRRRGWPGHRRADARRPSANLLFALCDSFPPAMMARGNQGKGRAMIPLRIIAVLCATIAGVGSSYADCSSLHRLAQQHANDMARRNSLDHSGFMRHRGPAGAVAENVAVGCDTEACARRMWMQSPAHRRNMTLGGCQAVASAVSATGRRYWAMLVGGDSRAVAGRAAGGKLARASRRKAALTMALSAATSRSTEATHPEWRPRLARRPCSAEAKPLRLREGESA